MKTHKLSAFVLLLALIYLFSGCATRNSENAELKITITETINSDEILKQLVKIDSLLGSRNHLEPLEYPADDGMHSPDTDTTGSYAEGQKNIQRAEKAHPLFFRMMPNINSQNGTVVISSFVGFSLHKDTATVTEMIASTHVLDSNIRIKWVPGPTPEVSALVLLMQNARHLELDNSSVDRIQYEKTEKFRNNPVLSTTFGIAGKLEYYITIFPIVTIDLPDLQDQTRKYLLETELCHKKYAVSETPEEIAYGMTFNNPVSQSEIDSLIKYYPLTPITEK